MARVLITLPERARRGEIVEIRVLINHPMETGYRRDADGQPLPRYDGETVFAAELHAAIAANPYLAFSIVASVSGTLVFSWDGDNGFTQVEQRSIVVT
jgi:sulfur-oxidizing protein SoxZ